MIRLGNKFLRWLAPKPAQEVSVYSDEEVHIDRLIEAIRKEDGAAKRLDMMSATVGDYARMSADFHRRQRIGRLIIEIARLKRNKKRHSHLQQELDSLK